MNLIRGGNGVDGRVRARRRGGERVRGGENLSFPNPQKKWKEPMN